MPFSNQSDPDTQINNSSANPEFQHILERRCSRRELLQVGSVLGTLPLFSAGSAVFAAQQITPSALTFTELPQGLDQHFTVAPGYQHQVLLRWGDPIFATASAFDPHQQSRASQEQRFGYNNDFVGFVPLPYGSGSSTHGLLVVNHETSAPELMFADAPAAAKLSKEQTDVDIASLGMSVVEIAMEAGQWTVVKDSIYNRRITPLTPMLLSGPAAGSPRLFAQQSADGFKTGGTCGNCAGGVTPWGTILSGEENIDAFFSGDIATTDEVENYTRFGMTLNRKSWGSHYEQWDLNRNPQSALHLGWIVEIDPYDPASIPKKRTALGRFKHEGCNLHINTDGRVVAYTGDDSQFEYIYKFVSDGRYQPDNRTANLDLLDTGTLSVARFNDDGTLNWIPLLYGVGPLTAANGFNSQADVLLDTRKAGDLLGATKMDRPEDVDINPTNGKVYVMLTNNTRRTAAQVDAANPRAANGHGQIVELWPADGDHNQEIFQWELFLLAGNPATDIATSYHPDTTPNGWLSCPDNCAFDTLGNIWIATDGAEDSGIADGLWAAAVDGEQRGLTKRFLRTPQGAELCGPFFTPDNSSLFCAVQHPAAGTGSTFDAPAHRWPDFDPTLPPRPAVVVITKIGGGPIGG